MLILLNLRKHNIISLSPIFPIQPSLNQRQLVTQHLSELLGSHLPRIYNMDGNISQKALEGEFGRYYNMNNMVVVDMGEVGIVNFAVYPAIGTYGLNSCSVALVASPFSAILTHIPPRPDLTNADPHASDNNTKAIMADFAQLYETYINFFPSGDSHIICAVFEGDNEPALPDHVAIIKAAFRGMGLDPDVHHYQIPVNHNIIGEGQWLWSGMDKGWHQLCMYRTKLCDGGRSYVLVKQQVPEGMHGKRGRGQINCDRAVQISQSCTT